MAFRHFRYLISHPSNSSFIVSIFITVTFMLLGCSRLPTPPAQTFNVSGLIRDPLTRIYSDSTGQEKFADLPKPFRNFYLYCSQCHSNLAPHTDALNRAKAKMNLNNWEEIISYGPARLYATAASRTMPLQNSTPIPDSVMNQVGTFLAGWSSGGSAITGTQFQKGKNLVTEYCADCHTSAGLNSNQTRAFNILPLDTYRQWLQSQRLIVGRLALNHPSGNPMPPPNFSRQPTPSERALLLDWLSRNSPDNLDGAGQGKNISIQLDSVVKSGALLDLKFAPAQRIVNHYCADCHTTGGNNKDKKDAWGSADIKLDSYAGWIKAQNTLKIRLDPKLAASQTPFPLDQMPKLSFAFQPSNLERDTLLQWLKNGSPNSESGE